jgi:hypothetical protein
MPSSSVTLLNFSVKICPETMGSSRLLLLLGSACPISAKESQEKKKGFENIYIPKKRKMDKEEKEVDKQEEFNAKEEVDLKKE